LKITFNDDTPFRFYEMRYWPKTFDLWIKNRRTQLLIQKEQLIKEMEDEVEHVFTMVSELKISINELLSTGLNSVTETDSKRRKTTIETLFAAMKV